MALLRSLTIRWKLSLSLILSGLILVGLYVALAKNVFESDKISYVFDSQASKLESLKREIEGKLERALLVSRTVIATYESATGKVSASGESIFREERSLLGLELVNEKTGQTLFRIEKPESHLPPSGQNFGDSKVGSLLIEKLADQKLLLIYRYNPTGAEIFRLQFVIDAKDLLPPATTAQSLAIGLRDKVLFTSDLGEISHDTFQKVYADLNGNESSEKTLIWGSGDQKYLISEKNLSFGKLKIISLTPESEALGALDTLFKRSLLFLAFSGFGLILISLTLARSMTSGLEILTHAAGEIGKGNFDAAPNPTSQDEIGVLGRAFQRMAIEIKDLLIKTRESVRMQEELKTASLIQERLLPHEPSATVGSLEISGMIRPCSECGGDWWYYFTRGDDLFVAIADATGHGTPAALITAAARSVFSRIENDNLSLSDMIRVWDHAIHSCSQKQVMMTGVLLRINSKTGSGSYISAAHESPFCLIENEADGSYSCDTLEYPPSPRLGSLMSENLAEVQFELKPNQSIVLYTDGLFSISKPGAKPFSERRFGKQLAEAAKTVNSANKLTATIFKMFDDYREQIPLPDDTSVVCIRRQQSKVS